MPRKAPHKCNWYGCNVLTYSRFCRLHEAMHKAERESGWAKDKRSRHERGYGAAWVRTREYVMRRDRGLCQPCLKNGIKTKATEVDHIRPKALRGSDKPDNLQAICRSCHARKTAQDRKAVASAKLALNSTHSSRQRPPGGRSGGGEGSK